MEDEGAHALEPHGDDDHENNLWGSDGVCDAHEVEGFEGYEGCRECIPVFGDEVLFVIIVFAPVAVG